MFESPHVVILAGGQGLRLWPWSRSGRSKPFLPMFDGRSLIEATLERALSLVPPERIHLVGTRDVIRDLGPFDWIEENRARDTAPAIFEASRAIHDADPSATILVFPADHRVIDVDIFRRGMRETIDRVSENPDRFWVHGTPAIPEESFGFIVPANDAEVSEVLRFEEKPGPHLFDDLLEKGALCNTGVFCFKAGLLLEEYRRVLSNDAQIDLPEVDDVPAISIDHFLLAREDFCHRLMVRKMSHRWSDVGSWPALRDVFRSDSEGNVLIVDPDRPGDVVPARGGDPVLLRSQAIEIDGDGSRQILCLGINDRKVRVTRDHVWVSSGEISSTDNGLVDCANLLVFVQDDVRISIAGIRGGLVAVTEDVVLVASEKEICSEGLREVIEALSLRTIGGLD